MRPQDKIIFIDAARALNLWILVRNTNLKSLKYIGLPGFTPKRIDCKAKTADNDVGMYRLSGLVVSPFLQPEAFMPNKLEDARMQWKKTEHLIGGLYKVNIQSTSNRYGCLMINGSYIHGDYDLYDIVDPEQPHRNLGLVSQTEGISNIRVANLGKVMEYVNSRIGTPMIQHGAQAQFSSHRNQSRIDVFGPHGEDVTILNEISLIGFYDEVFEGRKTLF